VQLPRCSFQGLAAVLVFFVSGIPSRGQVHPLAAGLRELNNSVLLLHAGAREPNDAAMHAQASVRIRQRAEMLRALMDENPAEALKLAFSPEVLSDLSSRFPDAAQDLETHGTWEGTFEATIFDYPDKSSRTVYRMKLGEQQRVEIHFAGVDPGSLQTGDLLQAEGVAIDGHVDVAKAAFQRPAPDSSSNTSTQGSTSTSTTNPVVVPGAIGSQTTLVMLVNFQDDNSQPYTPAEAAKAIFKDANAFMLENSYQQTSFTGDVVGWYTLPATTTALQTSGGCDTQTIQNQANAAATAAGVNLAGYRHLVYVFPQLSSCGFAGASDVGGNPSHSYINGDLTTHVVTHELGHALGVWHAHFLFCGPAILGPLSSCTAVEYGDPGDVMGSINDYAAHYNAFQKERLGWLNYGASTAIITATTSGTYSLQPFESVGSAPKAVKVFQSVDSTSGMNTYLYLEARKGIGYDSYLTSWKDPACINYTTTCPGYFCATGYYPCCKWQEYSENLTTGVVVHLGTPALGNTSYLLDMSGTTRTWYGLGTNYAVAVGQSFTDPISGVSIYTAAADASGATVVLTNVKVPPSSGSGGKRKR
jgi:hypothetical protein